MMRVGQEVQLRGHEEDRSRVMLREEALRWAARVDDLAPFLTPTEAERIAGVLNKLFSCEVIEFDHDFDVQGEINEQLRLLRTMRARADSQTLSIRDMKDTLASATQLIQLLIKEQEKVVNLNRIRTIESCVVEVVRTLPIDEQNNFLALLEERLNGNDR